MPFNNVINEKAYYGNNNKCPHILFYLVTNFIRLSVTLFFLEEVVAYGKGSTECFPLLHRLTYSVLPKL